MFLVSVNMNEKIGTVVILKSEHLLEDPCKNIIIFEQYPAVCVTSKLLKTCSIFYIFGVIPNFSHNM